VRSGLHSSPPFRPSNLTRRPSLPCVFTPCDLQIPAPFSSGRWVETRVCKGQTLLGVNLLVCNDAPYHGGKRREKEAIQRQGPRDCIAQTGRARRDVSGMVSRFLGIKRCVCEYVPNSSTRNIHLPPSPSSTPSLSTSPQSWVLSLYSYSSLAS